MHLDDLGPWRHSHLFGADRPARGEARTRWVVVITVAMMLVEIVAGTTLGSMALLADGWHMGTHAAALGVALFAYVYARRHAADPRYSFGTGKVGALGGFASAVGLAVVALLVLGESVARLARPVGIRFDEAIGVAAVGLAVNLACAWLLRDHDRGHGHGADPARGAGARHDHRHHRDHNLRAAYLHVLADALTSVLAIVALTAGKFLGWNWLDPAMGIAGSALIAWWSYGLIRDTSAILLDATGGGDLQRAIEAALAGESDNLVADLHVWHIAPQRFAATVSVLT
ncbi:MAG TPA: CDF family Co(II)/Ni(II) efflux transporter DmeF, partial [Anaeromyxobacteraceae bacterium]|nr:CDF family Co(II)/Ni(II) efflux transporter DmeF [Anaeromyxobacteraceae bacterium]